MNIWQRWRQTALHNRALVLSSVLMAFGTVFYAGAAVIQICMFQRSSKQAAEQTDKLIAAAKISASDATQNAAAAQSFAGSALKINSAIDDAVRKLQIQAEKMDAARVASERQPQQSLQATIDNFHREQRAWIAPTNVRLDGGLTPGKEIKVLIDFANSGKEPAFNVVTKSGAGLEPPFTEQDLATQLQLGPQYLNTNICEEAKPVDGMPVIYPSTVQHQSAQLGGGFLADDYTARRQMFFVFGCFGYRTMGEIHHSQFCFWLQVSPDGQHAVFSPCMIGNNAD